MGSTDLQCLLDARIVAELRDMKEEAGRSGLASFRDGVWFYARHLKPSRIPPAFADGYKIPSRTFFFFCFIWSFCLADGWPRVSQTSHSRIFSLALAQHCTSYLARRSTACCTCFINGLALCVYIARLVSPDTPRLAS